jgi:hypothetical protein
MRAYVKTAGEAEDQYCLLARRLLPPLMPKLADYHIAFTTPYILTHATRADWTAFIRAGLQHDKWEAALRAPRAYPKTS